MECKYNFYVIEKDEYESITDKRIIGAINTFKLYNQDIICITSSDELCAIYTFDTAKKYLNKNDIANISVAGSMIAERLNAQWLDVVSYVS